MKPLDEHRETIARLSTHAAKTQPASAGTYDCPTCWDTGVVAVDNKKHEPPFSRMPCPNCAKGRRRGYLPGHRLQLERKRNGEVISRPLPTEWLTAQDAYELERAADHRRKNS